MVSRRTLEILVTLILLGIGIQSCDSDPLHRVEILVGEYDFAEALELLHGLPDVPLDTLKYCHLKALVFLIEGQQRKAFEELETITGPDDKKKQSCASTIYQAAQIIIREKKRTVEALALLDSARHLDPGLNNDIINLAWARAIEYLHDRGDAGYKLMRYAIECDPKVRGRLRGYNRKLADQYEEMDRIQQRLDQWYRTLNNHPIGKTNSIVDLAGFISAIPSLGADTIETGWFFSLTRTEKGLQFIAETKHGHPQGVPWKTVMHSP